MLSYFLLFSSLDMVSESLVLLFYLPMVFCNLSPTLRKPGTQNWKQNLRYGCVIPKERGPMPTWPHHAVSWYWLLSSFYYEHFQRQKVEKILQLAPKYPLPRFHNQHFTRLALSQIYLTLYHSISSSFFNAFQSKMESSPLTFQPKLTKSFPYLFPPPTYLHLCPSSPHGWSWNTGLVYIY